MWAIQVPFEGFWLYVTDIETYEVITFNSHEEASESARSFGGSVVVRYERPENDTGE